MIRNLTLTAVAPQEEVDLDPELTLWINYRVSGHWYSKIVIYDDGHFYEEVAGGRIARYKSTELKQAVRGLQKQSTDLKQYSWAQVVSSKTETGQAEQAEITGEDFNQLISQITPANRIIPDQETKAHFENLLHDGVPPEDTNIYGIHLLTSDAQTTMGTENFMIYDQARKNLWFEGEYYKCNEALPLSAVGLH